MVVPITFAKNGEDQTVGTAVVTDDGEVEYYLQPGFTMAEKVMVEMTNQLKRLTRFKG